MLTYRIGSVTGPAGAAALAAHVLEATLPNEFARTAAYYAPVPGVSPDSAEGHGATIPEVRPDIDPILAQALGIDPRRPPTAEELAALLSGHRTDGQPIVGRRSLRYSGALADEAGLARDRMPTAEEVERVVSGRRADRDEALPAARAGALAVRLLRLYGAEPGTSVATVMEAAGRGRRVDGGPLRQAIFLDGIAASKGRTAFADLCFSSSKTVSVAWALVASDAERAVIAAAHREAADRTMRVIEATLGAVRRGAQGRAGTEPGRMGWIACRHFTSRPTIEIRRADPASGEEYTILETIKVAGDPQLHSHILTPAVSLTDSGHFGSPNFNVLAGRIHEWGAIFQAFEAAALRRAGVAVSLDRKTGAMRIDAVPEVVTAAFSKRTLGGERAAVQFASARGLDWATLDAERRIALLKAAVQDPRGAKSDDAGDVTSWRAQAATLGWTCPQIVNAGDPIPILPREERLDAAAFVAAELLAGAFQREAVLPEAAVRTAAARGLIHAGIETEADVDDVARRVLESGIQEDGRSVALIARVVAGPQGARVVHVTSDAILAREARIIALAREGFADTAGSLPTAAIDAGLASLNLDLSGEHGQNQIQAAHTLGTGSLTALIGVAGAGKTAILGALCHGWAAERRDVYGLAVAWRQASCLAAAGIAPDQCLALTAFLARVRAGEISVTDRTVIVVDEVSLVSSKAALSLMELRATAGATLVLVGDPKQGKSVEFGGTLDLLERAREGSLPTLGTTVRQRTIEERELASLAREGKAAEVLAVLRNQSRARLVAGTDAVVADDAAELWLERREAVGVAPLAVAPTHAAARLVSQAIRRRLQDRGEVGPDAVVVDAATAAGERFELAIAAGDVLRLFRRVYGSGGGTGALGDNGSIVRVAAVHTAGLTLQSASGRDVFVKWDALRSEEGRLMIGPGTVTTIDSAQGATCEECLLILPHGAAAVGAERFYVAQSRHRSRNYIIASEAAERRAIVAQHSPTDSSPVRAAEIWSRIATELSRSRQPETALAFMARSHEVRCAAQDVFRSGAARIAARQARGLASTTLPSIACRPALARAVAALRDLVTGRATLIAAVAAALIPRQHYEPPRDQMVGQRRERRPRPDAGRAGPRR